MSTQRYSTTPHTIETILTWVKLGESAIPKIQHRFFYETARIEGMVSKVEAVIEYLQEYHTALITAAVSWKIDVRGAAA